MSGAWRPPVADTLGPSGPGSSPPRRVVALLVALLVVVAGAVLLVPRLSEALRSDDPVVRDGARTEDRGLDLDAVRLEPDLDPAVVTGPVDYPELPPAGGPHWRRWLACGVYDRPVRTENAVASLARGAVWITYRPTLREEEVAAFAEVLPATGILSPLADIPAPAVITVWGAQLALTGADDRRLPEFLRVYGDGGTAPEAGAGCAGGTTDPAGDPG